MKKIVFLAIWLVVTAKLYSQSQGISYQAVIIDKNPQEVPGVDISGNILPNHALKVRFTILDQAGAIDYQEEHSTTTDAFGMINLIIGKGIPTTSSPNTFIGIDWNGTPKDLKVDVSLSTTDVFYTDFSRQELNFVPYAYHKNITATGSLIVDQFTRLKGRLDVTNGNPTFLSGSLSVDSATVLKNTLSVDSTSALNGQVTIKAKLNGDKSSYDAYPLRVEGSEQGVAIKIEGSRSSNNSFVTFMDNGGIQGRIEGQTTSELLTDPEYIFDNVLFANEVVRSTVDVVKAGAAIASASTSSTPCAGLGACVTAPVPSLIAGAIAEAVMESANLALVIAEPIMYNVFKLQNIGVTYQSGAGDYAEWLIKSNLDEKFYPGDVVGVKGGTITKATTNADHFMVISYKPIVLGNMPQEGKEANYEKVAFMGQVPVKVFGKVNIGDYILPDGNNNGTGIAVPPSSMQAHQYSQIVGVAWSASESLQYGYVNVAVGLNANDVARLSVMQEQKIKDQQAEINELKQRLDKMDAALSQLVPGYSDAVDKKQATTKSAAITTPVQTLSQSQTFDRTVAFYDVTREQILEGIALAEKTLKDKGVDLSSNPFFMKLKTEPGYKESFVTDLQRSVRAAIQANAEKDASKGAQVINK